VTSLNAKSPSGTSACDTGGASVEFRSDCAKAANGSRSNAIKIIVINIFFMCAPSFLLWGQKKLHILIKYNTWGVEIQ
jgi:hypothetical protein